ncbi:hypothetical protein AXG93_4012s1030 [Marchantia polymorpha subsp. ruderalis]|uniref:Signal recognition particle subunit SRP72 n=1 Tax=Marchantia polymorpha subsp. ruderalis TaxID=1480154 RepID=A0A176VL97_MARPO|nr:hypothetical protein AXG93_4012s1030 [Marchantia polymorpha subsp. ruderalis]
MAPKVKGKPKPSAGGGGAAAAAAPGKVAAKGGPEKIAGAGPGAGAPVGPSLDDLFKSLDRHVKNNDYKQVLKLTDDILKLSQGDKDAVECKVVALIQLDEFDQALSVIESAPGLDLVFQKAYCLYKRNRLQEALAALQNAEKNASVLQLEAQIQFKLGNFSACIGDYEKLLQKQQKIESDEVKSNVIAAYVSGGRSQEVPAVMDAMKDPDWVSGKEKAPEVFFLTRYNIILRTQSEVTRETGIYTSVVERVVVSNDYKDTSIVVV